MRSDRNRAVMVAEALVEPLVEPSAAASAAALTALRGNDRALLVAFLVAQLGLSFLEQPIDLVCKHLLDVVVAQPRAYCEHHSTANSEISVPVETSFGHLNSIVPLLEGHLVMIDLVFVPNNAFLPLCSHLLMAVAKVEPDGDHSPTVELED